jgi:tetratricopeptide (TPR) repeat protein
MKDFAWVFGIIGAFGLSGCVSWEIDSESPTAIGTSTTGSVASFRDLKSLADVIETEQQLRDSIAAHQRFVGKNPEHAQALVSLANHWLLMGTAYTESRKEKRTAFLEAMRCSEQAMRTDPKFEESVRGGMPTWEACELLGEEHMDAMLFWVTGVLYMFREGMVFPQHVAHLDWLDRADQVLEHMKSVDRNWNGGAVLFSQAIVYHSVPPSAGGDPEKAQDYLDEAISVDGDWMLSRWGRAKYFLTAPEDREARIADLREILKENPENAAEAPYWRRYFQTEARRILKSMDAPTDSSQ